MMTTACSVRAAPGAQRDGRLSPSPLEDHP
jgi:hypothetical protein